MPPVGSDPLRRLLDETSDLVDSPTAAHILTLLLDTLFSQLTDVALRTQAFKVSDQPPSDPSLRVQEVLDGQIGGSATADPGQTKAKLATILAVITRQAHAIGNGVPNAYVQAMEGVRELEAFAAVVYTSNGMELEGTATDQAAAADQGADEADSSLVEPATAASAGGIWESTWSMLFGGRSHATTGTGSM
jgi:peroxin-3